MLEVKPQAVVCDLHPKYNSTVVAEELGYPVIRVQHHYAHILSCMTENGCHDPVIGVAFDGTGYGTDGTIWGGEILLADYGNFTRFGSITPFLQMGGDASAKEGWRIAVSMIYGYTKDRKRAWEIMETLGLCSEQESRVQFTMADRKINAVASTSAGGFLMPSVRYSGSGAGQDLKGKHRRHCSLQQNLSNISQEQKENKDILLHETKERFVLNTQMLVQQITEAKMRGEDTGMLAYRFHQVLAEMITAACIKAKESSGRDKVALSGGVFQNRLLLRLTEERCYRKDSKCCGTA